MTTIKIDTLVARSYEEAEQFEEILRNNMFFSSKLKVFESLEKFKNMKEPHNNKIICTFIGQRELFPICFNPLLTGIKPGNNIISVFVKTKENKNGVIISPVQDKFNKQEVINFINITISKQYDSLKEDEKTEILEKYKISKEHINKTFDEIFKIELNFIKK